MDNYEVEVHGANVKVSVVDEASMIDETISELMSLQSPVMALDFKMARTRFTDCRPAMLLLCAGSRCLILPKLNRLSHYYPLDDSKSRFAELLADRAICFVRSKKESVFNDLDSSELRNMMSERTVELGHLAARILKKRNLEQLDLYELAGEVGPTHIKKLPPIPILENGLSFWGNRVFSEEEIKYAVHDVYASYLIGNKLLSML